jgi:SAM-dependent methyltransferase
MPADYHEIPIAGGDTAKPLALGKRLDILRRHLSPDRRRFLDCGCGAGDYVFALAELGLDPHGIEYDAAKVELGKRNPRHGHRLSQGDLQALALDSEQWDYAMLNEVLEHVPDERAALREIHRVLKPGGILFVFSPNRWFPFETHGLHLKSGRRVPHWMPFIPYLPLSLGNRIFDYWARNYWPGELSALVESAGFTVIERAYIWLTFEGISGRQPKVITVLKPLLRALANLLERVPLLRRFGVSQVLVLRKQ